MSPRYSISQLARRGGVSRSTLLYYDHLGLLRPAGRSANGYRWYGPEQADRLEAIGRYRQIGLSLAEVQVMLAKLGRGASALLEQRLQQIDLEVERLREQQRIIVRLLSHRQPLRRTPGLNKERWVEILRATGLDEAAMHRWHVEFERAAPQAHRSFLDSLGLSTKEVTRIRRWSRPRS